MSRHIMILGASSQLGQALVEAYASNNQLSLLGRDRDRLEQAAKLAQQQQAHQINLYPVNGMGSVPALLEQLPERPVDLLVNVSCATSSLHDHLASIDHMTEAAFADLIFPCLLAQGLVQRVGQHKDLHIQLISSILAPLNSPGRSIYTGYKKLQQAYLDTLTGHGASLSVVWIDQRLPRDRITPQHRKLARSIVQKSTHSGSVFCSLKGCLLAKFLYPVAPWLVHGLIRLSRQK